MSFNVRDYGAMGDAQTDDTQAFADTCQAAIDDLNQQQPGSIQQAPVIYVPPGFYLADVAPDLRISIKGERGESIIMAASVGGYAITYNGFAPVSQRHQRPFIQGISVQGTQSGDFEDRDRSGIMIQNQLGLDLIDVAAFRCVKGIRSADNYYGTWDRLMVTQCDVGIHFEDAGPETHTGNKRLFNPQFRSNGIALLFEGRCQRTALYGGTIEGNRVGIAFDFREDDNWNDANPLYVRDVWFEANGNNPGLGGHLSLRDGTSVEDCDLFVNDGTLVLTNCGVSRVYLNAQGRLYAYHSWIGRGPAAQSFFNVEPGAFFAYESALVRGDLRLLPQSLIRGSGNPT